MRVMLVCPYSVSRPGGVQGQVLGLAHALRRRDVDARVLAPCDGPPPEPGIISVGPSVEWENNGSVAPIAAGRQAADRTIAALRRVDPDVVHLHEPVVPGPSLSTCVGFEGPMVGTFHVSGDEIPHGYLRPAIRRVVARLDVRVAVSDAARRYAREHYDADAEVLWNGIEVDRFATAEPWPGPRAAVLFVGRHEPRKGLGVLLDAWRGLDRDADLWVVGQGPETEALRRRSPRGVQWLGPLDDELLARRLAGATVACFPSRSGESFGIVLLEAMAAGTALVASGIPGYANVARSDREALLVPPGDPDALRLALRRVLDDAALVERLVAAGRARAEEFSMDRLAAEYVERYDRALLRVRGERRRRGGRGPRRVRARPRGTLL